MLYDPRWEKDRVLHGVSLRGFIAWLEQQPPDEKYLFYKAGRCAVAQWLKSIGEPSVLYCTEVQKIIGNVSIVSVSPWTFGAALQRARKEAAR